MCSNHCSSLANVREIELAQNDPVGRGSTR